MTRKIVITSGKGGVGKTTVCANLGCHLSMLGLRVALVDIDFGLNNLDVVMGLENKVVYDIVDVIEGRCRAKQALVQDREYKNLYVLPSSRNSERYDVSGQNVKMVLNSLSPTFDYILIDCPAGIGAGFHRAVSCADEGIVVTTPHLSSLRDADKAIALLKSYRTKSRLVINKVRGDLILNREMISPDEIVSLLGLDLLGILPEEDNVFLYGNYGKTIAYKGDAKDAFSMLASNLHFGTRHVFDYLKKYTGFWGSIKRSIKRSL